MEIKNNTILVIDEGIEDNFSLDYPEELFITENLIIAKTIYNMYQFYSGKVSADNVEKYTVNVNFNVLINYGLLLEKFVNISRKIIKHCTNFIIDDDSIIENDYQDHKSKLKLYLFEGDKENKENNENNFLDNIIKNDVGLPNELIDRIRVLIKIIKIYGVNNAKELFEDYSKKNNVDEKNYIIDFLTANALTKTNDFIEKINIFTKNVLQKILKYFEILLSLDNVNNSTDGNININDVFHQLYDEFSDDNKTKKSEYNNGNRCFAIMDVDGELYYSFSSIYDYVGENVIMNNFLKCSGLTIKMQKFKKYIVNKILKSNKFKYANLTDKVKRYVEYQGFGLCHKQNKLKYSLLKDDTKNPIFSQYIRACYSCCERKLIEKLSCKYYHSIKFYIRYIPCEMCLYPVQNLINCTNNVEVFAINDENNNAKNNMKTYHLKIDNSGI